MPARRTITVLAAFAARAAVVAIVPLALVGCVSSGAADSTPRPTETLLSGQVTVLAAASLTETFASLASEFEAANPNVDIVVSYGGSSALAEQIVAGAPVAIFAAASPATMQTVTDAGLTLGEPVTFAQNVLEIAVPPGNPGGVTGLADFGDAAKVIAICAPEVPCGAAAVKAFAAAGITAAPDTFEPDVRSVLTKVKLAEVDAGLVYRTDVLAAGDAVEGIPLTDAEQVTSDDVVAAISPGGDTDAARAFLAFLLSDHARQVFADAGFQTP